MAVCDAPTEAGELFPGLLIPFMSGRVRFEELAPIPYAASKPSLAPPIRFSPAKEGPDGLSGPAVCCGPRDSKALTLRLLKDRAESYEPGEENWDDMLAESSPASINCARWNWFPCPLGRFGELGSTGTFREGGSPCCGACL